ncbi:MAG: hypothetical protein FJ247_00990 [Nitrospira sp.]|nr:hypothetical protein [Nitrospira sp.]
MKLASDRAAGFQAPVPSSLETVMARLDSLSLRPEFAVQREMALARALRPYLQRGAGGVVAPLVQETELAELSLLCDFYPEDGQLTLIEQLRDIITEHIPNEERAWLDPLKHSYMDLLEPTLSTKPGDTLSLRSLGDGTTFILPGGEFAKDLAAGQVLLTRVIRVPGGQESGRAIWAGCGIALSSSDAETVLEMTAEWRREMEMSSGSFALGEWQEFAKRFGYMLLWAFAELRVDALVDAVAHIRFRTQDGQPYLYAVALYDHHEYRLFADRLAEMEELRSEHPAGSAENRGPAGSVPPTLTWVQRETGGSAETTVARLTLTSSQLIVECDGPERLDRIKHRLAASLGFSLHFRGESLAPPARQLSVGALMSDEPLTVVVTQDEDCALLNQFLDKAYLEWSDQPHRSLGGLTPRHAAASEEMRGRVGALIDEMAQHDPGLSRMGRTAFDYNRLRAHVGLDDVLG